MKTMSNNNGNEMRNNFVMKGGEEFASCFIFDDNGCWVDMNNAKGCLTDESFDYEDNEISYTGGTEKFNSTEEAIERLYEIYSMND